MSKEKQRKCHFIITRSPFPAIGGDRVKSFNMIKILNSIYCLNIVLVTEELVDENAIEFLRQNSSSVSVYNLSLIGCYWRSFQSLFTKNSMQESYYYSKNVALLLEKQFHRNDIVICNLIRTARYASDFDGLKILDAVDSIFLNYKRSISETKNLFWKVIYYLEKRKICNNEWKWVQSFSLSLFVNSLEAKYYEQWGTVRWIPNGVWDDLLKFNIAPKQSEIKVNTITFLGKMNYQPNVDAVKWVCKHVMPLLPPYFEFLILGSEPDNSILKLAAKDKRVKVLGFVSDPYQIMRTSSVFVAPMQTGGGIQNKILEALAIGCCVITTPLGASPISGGQDSIHFYTIDDASKLAQKIIDVSNHSIDTTEIRQNAINFIKNNFTWGSYRSLMIKSISEIK
ncbi:MAG: glycosyltransferase [Bacteroidetes bacterium]|nr:MAG: glycosyltransferase [Bacteroidota bacterium]